MGNNMEDTLIQQGNALFIELSGLLKEGKGEEAIALLSKNRDLLFKVDPAKTLRANFELRFLLDQFDEAYEDLEYFSNLPYVNQEIEETLRGLPKLIRANELASSKKRNFDEEEAHAALSDGEDPYAVLGILQQLKERDLTPYLEEIRALLSSSIHDDVKTFALLLLVEKNINDEFLLIKKEKTYRINPSKLGNPFSCKEYLETRKKIVQSKDASLVSVGVQLLDQITISCYPERLFKEGEGEDFLLALIEIAKSYLGIVSKEKSSESMKKRLISLLETPTLMN